MRAPAVWSVACVLLAVFVANAAYILHLRTNNPLLYYSGLGLPKPGLKHGLYTIDSNQGWTVQTLGHLSAQSWLHGHVPLWNLYEGLGQPLAGEMQSAALFLPFVLLQALPGGLLLFELSLELVGGISTLLLLRSLRLSWVAATTGACLFAINGTFSVMTNAPFNPIAFLPTACWGVELIAQAARAGKRPRAGLWVTAFAIAFMMFAGFPETAFLEALFVACWAVMRLATLRGCRRAFVGWSVVGAIAGVVLAAPVLVAFKDMLDFGFTAYHSGVANSYSYPKRQITTLALPYASGPLGNHVFALQAGYVTLPAVLVGLVGFFGRKRRAMQVVLGVIVAALVLNMFGFAPVKAVMNHIPGVQSSLTSKYGLALIEFAVIVCVAYGIDDLRRSRVRRVTVLSAAAVTAAYLLGSMWFLHHRNYLVDPGWTAAVITWTVIACVALAGCLLVRRKGVRGAAAVTLAASVILFVDAAAAYAVPQVTASPRSTVDLGPVRFLQANLGTYRFFTLGPIQPNYGSYWRLSELNANDLPVPEKFSSYVDEKLRPTPGSPGAKGTRHSFNSFQLVPFNPGRTEQLALLQAYGERQAAYRAVGVKFLVTRRHIVTAQDATLLGLRQVYRDYRFEIWQDRKAAPYYATSGGNCQVREESLTAVSLTCDRPATLVRRQLSTPGWTATINGTGHRIADDSARLFQTLTVPAGASTVSFSYLPKYFVPATAASLALVGLMLADGATLVFFRRRRRNATIEDNS